MTSTIGEKSSIPLPQVQEQEQLHKQFNCFYCIQTYSNDKERVKHIDNDHPGKDVLSYTRRL